MRGFRSVKKTLTFPLSLKERGDHSPQSNAHGSPCELTIVQHQLSLFLSEIPSGRSAKSGYRASRGLGEDERRANEGFIQIGQEFAYPSGGGSQRDTGRALPSSQSFRPRNLCC